MGCEPRLGILCGLETEARLARRIAGAHVACSAARSEQARRYALALVGQGATDLLSFGLAGGLKPGLPAGTIILGTKVSTANASWEVTPAWLDKLRQKLPQAQIGPIQGVDAIIASCAAKAEIYRMSQSLAADMESHYVAEIASAAKIPFALLRVITDTADMAIPPAALVPLHKNGRIDLPKILQSLLFHPTQVPSLLKLDQNTQKAMGQLQEVTKILSFNPT